jgi:hypothetical protein
MAFMNVKYDRGREREGKRRGAVIERERVCVRV